jgi:hypothetical protein
MMINDDLLRIWKETVVAFPLFWWLVGETYANLQDEQSSCRNVIGTIIIRAKTVITTLQRSELVSMQFIFVHTVKIMHDVI